MQENEKIEFKQEYTDNIYKEIIAFLNTCSGTILVGYDDNGNLVGLDNAKEIEERISNGIIQKITPDCSVFVSINLNNLENKEYIVINVSKGLDIYYLKDKGILKGTYIRNGSCSIPTTDETVKQMIIKNSNLTYETTVSNNQDLTFNYISKAFQEINIDLNDNNIKTNLHLKNSQDQYTNLALLLSDQNPFTIKIAVYESFDKSYFLDRKEFTGSLLEIYDKTIDYLKTFSIMYGLIDDSIRKDIEEYPEFILREITLNSLIHRNYSSLASNIINIYKDKEIEFISYGSLYGDITLDDVLAGLSNPRNPYLQAIFMRLKRVEAIGSGLRRVNAYYQNKNLKLDIQALPASFVVKIPRITLENVHPNNPDTDIIIDYLRKNGTITRKITEELINREKTTASNLLNKMLDNNIIKKIGHGPNISYVLK